MYCQVMNYIYCGGPDSPIFHIDIDLEHIRNFDELLHQNLINYPKEMLQILDSALTEVYHIYCGQNAPKKMRPMEVRPFNQHTTHRISDLTPEKLDTLVTIPGKEYIKTIITCLF